MLTVIIITKNEALNIARCLESVSFADECIVVDSGSSDDTIKIAKQYTDKVYSLTDWQGYGVQKSRALSYATQPWVLNLDADEWVDEACKKAILEAINNNKYEAYRIPIRMHFYGKALKYSGSPSRHIRLFKREGADYSKDIVHEKIVLPKSFKIGKIKTSIQHNSFQDIKHVLAKINTYSSYTAQSRIAAGKSCSVLKASINSLWMFLRCYGIQRGFLDGKAGFLFAVFQAHGAFYRGIKQSYKDV